MACYSRSCHGHALAASAEAWHATILNLITLWQYPPGGSEAWHAISYHSDALAVSSAARRPQSGCGRRLQLQPASAFGSSQLPSLATGMRMSVVYGGPARGQARKLLRGSHGSAPGLTVTTVTNSKLVSFKFQSESCWNYLGCCTGALTLKI